MFRHPASGRRSYGAFDAALTFHVLANGDVWAYTNMDKSMATVVYSAKLGRQTTSDDNYPLVQGGRIAQLQGDTVSSEKTIDAAAAKAKAQIEPPPAAPAPAAEAPKTFVPADAMTVSVTPAAPAATTGIQPYLVGALAAVALLTLGAKLMPRGA
jgi:hypothetical protein